MESAGAAFAERMDTLTIDPSPENPLVVSSAIEDLLMTELLRCHLSPRVLEFVAVETFCEKADPLSPGVVTGPTATAGHPTPDHAPSGIDIDDDEGADCPASPPDLDRRTSQPDPDRRVLAVAD